MSQDHSLHQTDMSIRMQVLNISVNMARMGELVLKFGQSKSDLIEKFLGQTESYLGDLQAKNVSDNFKPTLEIFKREFEKLRDGPFSSPSQSLWAERAITWGDILQIRSRLL